MHCLIPKLTRNMFKTYNLIKNNDIPIKNCLSHLKQSEKCIIKAKKIKDVKTLIKHIEPENNCFI